MVPLAGKADTTSAKYVYVEVLCTVTEALLPEYGRANVWSCRTVHVVPSFDPYILNFEGTLFRNPVLAMKLQELKTIGSGSWRYTQSP
jgi:hypothetical protein